MHILVYRQVFLGPVDPSFRALSERFRSAVRRDEFGKDSLRVRRVSRCRSPNVDSEPETLPCQKNKLTELVAVDVSQRVRSDVLQLATTGEFHTAAVADTSNMHCASGVADGIWRGGCLETIKRRLWHPRERCVSSGGGARRKRRIWSGGVLPKPSTLDPRPQTMDHKPYTLHPTP